MTTVSGRRAPGRGWVLAFSVAILGLSVWASISVLGTPSNQCDNMAGTCIHMRQQAAISVIDVVCVVVSAIAALIVVALCRGANPSRLQVTALSLCGVFALAVLIVDPISHLDSRWSGWLGGHP